jgi:hypothetical protein
MNLTKEEIGEIKEALETHESFLNGTDMQATETIDMSVDGIDTFTILVRWVQLILKQLKYCKAYKKTKSSR